jgi:hypothetical protein
MSDSRLRLNDAAEQWLKANDPAYKTNRYRWSTRSTDAMAQKLVPLTDELAERLPDSDQPILLKHRNGTLHQYCRPEPASDAPKPRRMPHRPWTDQARRMRRAGKSIRAIAKELGRSQTAVFRATQ